MTIGELVLRPLSTFPCLLLAGIAFLAAGQAFPLRAQNVVPLEPSSNAVLTLEAAVRDAVQWHPSIEQAIGSLSASSQEIAEARAGYSPQISGGVRPSLTFVRDLDWRPRATLSASQMLHDFGKVGSSVDAARAGERLSRANLLLAIDGLVRNTSYALVEVQRHRALLTVAEEQLESLSAIQRLVQLRVRRGASPRAEGVQAEARIRSAQATIQQITAELHRWQSNLRHLTGRDDAMIVSADVPSWLNRACRNAEPEWNQVPAVLQAIAARDQAQATYRGARAAGLPVVSLEAAVDTDLRDPFTERNDISIGVSVSSSLYSGGARRAREQAALYAFESADAALMAAQVEASRTLNEGREQVDSLADRMATLAQRRSYMQETGELYRKQYFELGTRTLLDLLNAEQEFQQTRFEEVNAAHDMRRLDIDCLYFSGALRDSYGLSGMVIRGVTL